MTGGQIAALVFAILLLLPGGCFMLFGIAFSSDSGEFASGGPVLILIALGILGVAGLLFWVALRRRKPQPGGGV